MKRITTRTTVALVLGLGLTIGFVWLTGTGALPVARASTYTVTNTNASGPGSLRQAILDANANGGHDTVNFAPSVGGTIVLTGTLPPIDDDLTIAGPGPDTLSVSGDNAYRVLEIASSTAVTISGLTIRDGGTPDDWGGGIFSEGILLLDTVDVVSNTAWAGAGMFIWSGSATLSGTQIISNVATGDEASGGGLYLQSGSVTLKGGQIAHNKAYYGGGAYVDNTSAVFTQTGDAIIFDNTAAWGAGVSVFRGSATLAGGRIISNTASDYGGGVYVRYGSFSVSGGQILSNTCTADESSGGGVYIYEGNATLSGGEIAHNAAYYGGGVFCGELNAARFTQTGGAILHNTGYWGGGVFVGEGSATLSGGQIFSNTAAEYGGGVYVYWSTASFTQTGGSVAANIATYDGGGVYVWRGSATLSGGQIISNTAWSGGGVHVYWSTASFAQTGGSVAANTATYRGGGVYVWRGSATLSGGQILNNTADNDGGGIYNFDGTAALTNTTVSSNRAIAGSGGGLYSDYGTTTITFTTIASNTAASGGYGIHRAHGTVLLQNTIVAHNGTTATNCSGVLTSNGHNLEYGNTCNLTATDDITDTNPLLGPLTYDSSTWVHPLQKDSPAIDAGLCVAGVTTDQRGVTRPQGSACDIGAYEWDRRLVYLPLVLSKAEGPVLRDD
ncbi:MAG: hypothetical protein JXA14_02735 [Anaerolineae bacterium]|nr:hypothetical protein [Anaerolineae bacterium]